MTGDCPFWNECENANAYCSYHDECEPPDCFSQVTKCKHCGERIRFHKEMNKWIHTTLRGYIGQAVPCYSGGTEAEPYKPANVMWVGGVPPCDDRDEDGCCKAWKCYPNDRPACEEVLSWGKCQHGHGTELVAKLSGEEFTGILEESFCKYRDKDRSDVCTIPPRTLCVTRRKYGKKCKLKKEKDNVSDEVKTLNDENLFILPIRYEIKIDVGDDRRSKMEYIEVFDKDMTPHMENTIELLRVALEKRPDLNLVTVTHEANFVKIVLEGETPSLFTYITGEMLMKSSLVNVTLRELLVSSWMAALEGSK